MGRETLLQVLNSQSKPGLLTDEAAEMLAQMCGGLLKESIGPAQPNEVEHAIRQVRNTYRVGLAAIAQK